MTLQNLFTQCRVLPVDATVSLTDYLTNIRQALQQAKDSEAEGDIDKAALLHIRVLQLICKTLPSHPEHDLLSNRHLVQELGRLAHTGFANIERVANLLKESDPESRVSQARRQEKLCHVTLSASLVEVFERLAAKNTAKALCTVGLLAGKRIQVEGQQTITVSALVVPSQTNQGNRSDVRYETDVSHLLSIKNLTLIGFIQMCPNLSRLSMTPAAMKMLAEVQQSTPEAMSIIIVPNDPDKLRAFALTTNGGMRYVLGCTAVKRMAKAGVIPKGEQGEGQPIWKEAKHLNIMSSSEPFFKLYDLRPLAAARDDA